MPDVHFIGEIEYAVIDNYSHASVTYAFVPGSSAWFLKGGRSFGETHTTTVTEQDSMTFNHPLDAHFDTSSAEGWPFFVCEMWDKSSDGARNFIGCGGAWLPQSGIQQPIDVFLWKPTSMRIGVLSEMLLPTCPDLKALRELTVSPYLRSQIETDTMGTVRISVNTISSGFEAFGLKM